MKEINKTLNNNNLINESIDGIYGDLEEVIDSGDKGNYDINSSQMFTKDMIIKDKDLIKTVKQPIIQLIRINDYYCEEYNKLFINNKNENKTQKKVKNNKRLNGKKSKSMNGLKVFKCHFNNECIFKTKYK